MTTTLRPSGPERREADGSWARSYAVCVNSRTVGGIELGSDPRYGLAVGRITALAIDEGDRRRGRGTVAALAAEEVLRYRGCTRVEIAVPPAAEHAPLIAAALGYTEISRNMAKDLGATRHPLPAGGTTRPLSAAEYETWIERQHDHFAGELIDRGVPRDQAAARAAAGFAAALPDGQDSEGTALLFLDQAGDTVGHLLLRVTEPAFVFSVAVEAAHRGRGHGRTLMLVAENAAREAGAATIQLHVFASNTPALGLYTSLGYRTTLSYFAKSLS
ncbi:GNAT family N-acetyltransferase [Streptomyces polygonati]|uniref:GNAT family N-acetyltransferase n=1 Tax=Streptomyces polygonati TaxID=1617087 RepID=A0ABV8HPQ6_9ACTN